MTPSSPEAMEEILWMAFFPTAHEPTASAVLSRNTSHSEFESFYNDHINKILSLRSRARYPFNGHYNITRLEYTLKLFPAARFIIPVRRPVDHVASPMKQHRLSCRAQCGNPRALAYLRRVGHFEFGVDRRPIKAGDRHRVAEILALWDGGGEVRGWIRYWSHVYGFVADRPDGSPEFRRATAVVRFEDLCTRPKRTLGALMQHCRIDRSETLVEEHAAKIRSPDYYDAGLSEKDIAVIDEANRGMARRFRY